MNKEFVKNDSDIINQGAEYVAMNYAWEAAVFFWSKSNLNSKADTMNNISDIHNITYVVNSLMSDSEYSLRESAYKKWTENYIFPF